MIDLVPRHLDLVRGVLQAYVPGVEVRAYGSRVKGNAEKFSDLDLVLAGGGALAPGLLESLRDAFSESDLPIMVDVLDGHAISDSMRSEIEKGFEILQRSLFNPCAVC